MLRRVGTIYLWFSPLVFIILAALYHAVSFWAGLAGGIMHLALVAIGIHARGPFRDKDNGTGSLLGATLLVVGGAVVWATGPSGPPNPAHPAISVYNNAGLTLGFFITLLGFAAIVPALASTREKAVGSLGLVCFALMFVMWLLYGALAWSLFNSPLSTLPSEQRPEWFQILREFANSIVWRLGAPGYLAGAMLAEMTICAGWVRRRVGRIMSIYCLLGTIVAPLLSVLVARSATISRSQLSTLALLLSLPYLPPAMMCLVPYYVGVLALAHAEETRSVAVASELARASTTAEA